MDSTRSAFVNDITGARKKETSLTSLDLEQVYRPKFNEVFFTHLRTNEEANYSDVTNPKNVKLKADLPLGATRLPTQGSKTETACSERSRWGPSINREVIYSHEETEEAPKTRAPRQEVVIDANGTYKNYGKFIHLQPEHRSCSSGIEVARQETMRIEVRHLLEVDGSQQDKPTSGVPARAGLAG